MDNEDFLLILLGLIGLAIVVNLLFIQEEEILKECELKVVCPYPNDFCDYGDNHLSNEELMCCWGVYQQSSRKGYIERCLEFENA